MTPPIRFRFESSATRGYVPILGDSALVQGPIASQDAGSSNVGIYYQVGGGGLNYRFEQALQAAGQLDAANAALVQAYDARFGPGAWARDAPSGGGASPPLTSFLIPLTPGAGPVGARVTGLMYSVGPVLGTQGITDPAAYAAIYADAMAEVGRYRAAGHALAGLRITMLSTGIYATTVHDPKALFVTAAASIIDGIAGAVKADASLADLTILINTDDTATAPKERYGFDTAATHLGLALDASGFDVPVP
jgi:hypothetical protein